MYIVIKFMYGVSVSIECWTLQKKFIFIIVPRSDRRDLLAIKFKSEIFTEKERPSCCEHLQKI